MMLKKVIARSALTEHHAAQDELAATLTWNKSKPDEYGYGNALTPAEGAQGRGAPAASVARTLSEGSGSTKTAAPPAAPVSRDGSPVNARINDAGQPLTTHQGDPSSTNQSSDLIRREKITHFHPDAHGFFECYKPLMKCTRAAPFAQEGKRTPVFVRFSTVAGDPTPPTPLAACGVSRDAMKFFDLVNVATREPNAAISPAITIPQ